MQRDKWRQAHNEPIQILLEYGAIGLVLFIGLVISTLRKTCYSNSFLMACLVALIVDSFGFFPFRISPIGYLGMIYLAIIDRGHNAILRNG
jgi:O-antigen ligase